MTKYSDLVALFPNSNHYKFDRAGFKHAVDCACHDMTARTMKLKPNKNLHAFIEKVCSVDGTGTSYIEILEEYFKDKVKSSAPKYDEWHEAACNKILAILKDYYMDVSVTYGKAQKVVNITMKWICVLDGAQPYYERGYFKYCHMALDSFILEWIYRRSQMLSKPCKLIRDNMVSWSNISSEPQVIDKKKIKSYSELQELARTICSNSGLTPFETEFYVWRQMQLTLAAEALYDEESGSVTKTEFKKKPLSDKISLLKECLSNTKIDRCLI